MQQLPWHGPPQANHVWMSQPQPPAPQESDNHAHLLLTRASYVNDRNQLKNILSWILDSGATNNFVNDKSSLKDYRRFREPKKVYLGDNTAIYAEGLGTQQLQTGPYILELSSWFVPSLAENLISTRLLDQAGYSILIENNIVQIRQ